MMSPSPTAVNVAMEISRSAANCCLGESVCKLTLAHVCASFCVCLCTRFIFNCHPQSASWTQSVIWEAQRGVNSWDSFTSVVMDFLHLCRSCFFFSPRSFFFPFSLFLSLHIAFSHYTVLQNLLQSRETKALQKWFVHNLHNSMNKHTVLGG